MAPCRLAPLGPASASAQWVWLSRNTSVRLAPAIATPNGGYTIFVNLQCGYHCRCNRCDIWCANALARQTAALMSLRTGSTAGRERKVQGGQLMMTGSWTAARVVSQSEHRPKVGGQGACLHEDQYVDGIVVLTQCLWLHASTCARHVTILQLRTEHRSCAQSRARCSTRMEALTMKP